MHAVTPSTGKRIDIRYRTELVVVADRPIDLERVREAYGDSIDIQGMHLAMDEIWATLQEHLTNEEKRHVSEIAHVTVPQNNLTASIVIPPSRLGYFILLDAMLEVRLAEIFTAPRNVAAWSAAYVYAAWDQTFNLAYWVEPAIERLLNLKEGDGIPELYTPAVGTRVYLCA